MSNNTSNSFGNNPGNNPGRPVTAKYSPAVVVGAGALCALAIAGIVTAVMLAFGSGNSATAAPVVPTPAHSVTPAVPTKPTTPATPTTPNTPVTPSASVESLQRQLAQLNYYEGPISGVMNTQTTQAITYLQRDAHLPQTGHLNAETQTALNRFLAQGNNQMAG